MPFLMSCRVPQQEEGQPSQRSGDSEREYLEQGHARPESRSGYYPGQSPSSYLSHYYAHLSSSLVALPCRSLPVPRSFSGCVCVLRARIAIEAKV